MATPSSWTEAVTNRTDNDTLVALTNDDSTTQDPTSSVNSTRLTAAIDAAKGDFAVLAGFDPLLSDPSHVNAVVTGVLSVLMIGKLSMMRESDMLNGRFVAQCRSLRQIYTSSPGTTNRGDDALTRSERAPNNRIVRPDSDRANYRRYLPLNHIGNRRFPGEW